MKIDFDRKMTEWERICLRKALAEALAALDATPAGSTPDGLKFYFTDERGCGVAEIDLPFAEAVQCTEHNVQCAINNALDDGFITGDEHYISWGVAIPVMRVYPIEDEDDSEVVNDFVLREVWDDRV